MTKCDLCGTPVEVVGRTTLHYEPIKTEKSILTELRAHCKRNIKNSDDWRVVANYIDKQLGTTKGDW